MIKWITNIITHYIEYFSGLAGWVIGVFIARMWGPLLHHGLEAYKDEMSKFLPEIIIHLRACNEMLLTLMEQQYNDKDHCPTLQNTRKNNSDCPHVTNC